jgi:hypothetical protein
VWDSDNGVKAKAFQRDDPRFGFAWRLSELSGDGMRVRNRAKATVHCDGCRAVAVAVEVVLVSHASGTIDATNLAVSRTDCSHCASTAVAYQFVLVSPGRLVLRRGARTALDQLAAQMRRVALAGGTDAVVRQREAALAARMAAVLRSGVVRIVDHPAPGGTPDLPRLSSTPPRS